MADPGIFEQYRGRNIVIKGAAGQFYVPTSEVDANLFKEKKKLGSFSRSTSMLVRSSDGSAPCMGSVLSPSLRHLATRTPFQRPGDWPARLRIELGPGLM
jgi:SPX domain protein involved in polyphosphate accumulation